MKNRAFRMAAFFLTALAIIIAGYATCALAAVSTLPCGTENPLLIRYPELVNQPAPFWIKEGTRATYSVIASTSDAEHGEGVDWGTGSPGAGLSQVDVVGIEEGLVATYTVPYAPDSQGAMRPLVGFGGAVPAGCGDFWCSPVVLAKIQPVSSEGFTVSRLPASIGDRTYQAIRFDFKSDTFEMALVYDLQTGVLLHHTVDYSSYRTEKERLVGSSASHAIYTLRSLRVVNIPWSGGEVPAWIKKGQIYTFLGQSTTAFPSLPDVAPTVSQFTARLSVLDARKTFVETRSDIANQDPVPPPYVKTVNGRSQLGGFFLTKEAMAALHNGIVDSDPQTGMVVSVDQSDASRVVIKRTNQVDYSEISTYDSSGRLIQLVQQFNPDVITSGGFGSVREVSMNLAE